MTTTRLITICLSVLVAQCVAFFPRALISPGVLGRQAVTDFQNSRHSLRSLPRTLSKSSFGPALAPVPYLLSANGLPFEPSPMSPQLPLTGLKSLERTLTPHCRLRRQAGPAMDLALSHTDGSGADRPVGRLHGYGDLSVTGNSRSHHHVEASAGVGSVLWRSRNNRHSVGVGATIDHHRGSYHGYRYRSRPRPSVGIGYRMRF